MWKAYVNSFQADKKRGVKAFCRDVPIYLNGEAVVVKPHTLQRLIKKVQKHGDGGYMDRRQFNPGAKSVLTPAMQLFIREEYAKNGDLGYDEYCGALEAKFQIATNPSACQRMGAPESKFYYAVRRFIKKQDWIVHSIAKKGLRATRALLGGSQAPQRFEPGELWVSDTVSLNRIKIKYKGKIRTVQVTFILDAGSRYCIAVVVHFKEGGTHAQFMKVLQRALLSSALTKSNSSLVFFCPEVLLTDNGSIYKNKYEQACLAELGIKHAFAAKYCPRSNGRAEAFSKIVRSWMEPKLVLESQALTNLASIEKALLPLVERYNQRPKKALEWKSPQEFLNQQTPNSRLKTKTKAEILHATKAYATVKFKRGTFKHAGETYTCIQKLEFDKVKRTIIFDPGQEKPSEIEVVHHKQVIGIAKYKSSHDIPPREWIVRPPNRSKEEGEFLDEHRKKKGIFHVQSVKDSKHPCLSSSQKPKEEKTPTTLSIVATPPIEAEPTTIVRDVNLFKFQIWDEEEEEAA